MKRLENKIAVVYGNGTIGTAVAKAFSKEGAKVYLTGRSKEKLDATAKEIQTTDRNIQIAVVDALNEEGVDAFLDTVIKSEGRIDISFNAIGIPLRGIQGIPLTELPVENFMTPIITYMQSHFITSKLAARQMTRQGSGLVLMHTPNASRTNPPFVGGCIAAWAAMEALCRAISLESGNAGVRAVCLHTTAIPETPLIDEVFNIHSKVHGVSFQEFHVMSENQTHRRKMNTLKELTDAAVFLASDEGSAISGTILNLTAGMVS